MKIVNAIATFCLICISSICLNAQVNAEIRIDTIWTTKNNASISFLTYLPGIVSRLDSNARISSDWYNSYEKYEFDHSNIFKILNKNLSTKSFSDVRLILFFCISYGKESKWIRVEEWHFCSKSKFEVACKKLRDINQINLISIAPINWVFIPYNSKIYFISSEEYYLDDFRFNNMKKTILDFLSVDESLSIEYGSRKGGRKKG